MQVILLFAMIAAAFTLQYQLDAREIRREGARNGWSSLRMRWTPFGPKWLMRSRTARSYWLCYRDASGRFERRLCSVEGVFFLGSADVAFESASSAPTADGSLPSSGRFGSIVLCAGLGAFLGAALGIGATFLIVPKSNIAPAYGVPLGGALGLVAGAIAGALRAR